MTLVPDLISALYEQNKEIIQPSEGPPLTVENDAHLRLRRTLTPSLYSGLKPNDEAQFMVQGSTGKRISLHFEALGGHEFQMDAYVWAPSKPCKRRVLALHGMTPGISRTRWHSLGERLTKENDDTYFVALDWHSIDRTDKPQDAFLTLLPKHIFSYPDNAQEFIDMFPDQNKGQEMMDAIRTKCPRSFEDAEVILRAVIEQGLGWLSDDIPFVICLKSWSGGFVNMLVKATREEGQFKQNLAGAVLIHPAAFLSEVDIKDAMKDLPALLCWAKDDNKVPYQLSERYLVHDRVKLVTYEAGGHHNYDGSSGLPNFDDDIIDWFQSLDK